MSQFISLQDAVAMTTRYRKDRDTILQAPYGGDTILPNAESFDRSQIEALLAQPACSGLRIYYGMDEGLAVHLILVAIDDKSSDIVPAEGVARGEDEEGLIIQTGQRCPPDCDDDSPLNP